MENNLQSNSNEVRNYMDVDKNTHKSFVDNQNSYLISLPSKSTVANNEKVQENSIIDQNYKNNQNAHSRWSTSSQYYQHSCQNNFGIQQQYYQHSYQNNFRTQQQYYQHTCQNNFGIQQQHNQHSYQFNFGGYCQHSSNNNQNYYGHHTQNNQYSHQNASLRYPTIYQNYPSSSENVFVRQQTYSQNTANSQKRFCDQNNYHSHLGNVGVTNNYPVEVNHSLKMKSHECESSRQSDQGSKRHCQQMDSNQFSTELSQNDDSNDIEIDNVGETERMYVRKDDDLIKVVDKMDVIKNSLDVYLGKFSSESESDNQNDGKLFAFIRFVNDELDRLFSQINEWTDSNTERLNWLEKSIKKGAFNKEIQEAINRDFESRKREREETYNTESFIMERERQINRVSDLLREAQSVNDPDIAHMLNYVEGEIHTLRNNLNEWSENDTIVLDWLEECMHEDGPEYENIYAQMEHERNGTEPEETETTFTDKYEDMKLFENNLSRFERKKAKNFSTALNEKCNICLENFKPDTKLLILHCKHFYCEQCIKKWFIENVTCPVCWKTQFEI